MTALIFSDSHLQFSPMMEAIESFPKVDWIIHAGDMHQDVEDLMAAFPKIPVAYVKGNNDFFLPDVPADRFFELFGVKIFLTHGHKYGVKHSLFGVTKEALSRGADVCIFGHTHIPHSEIVGGIHLFNPGSARKSFGVLEIDENGFSLELREI